MGEPVRTLSMEEEELLKKLVQEISRRGDEIPERFIEKDGIPEAIDAPDGLWNDTLLIDFSLLASSDRDELAKFRSALTDWGCFYVKNHGIELAFLEEFIQVSKQFFELPVEERLKLAGTGLKGYGSESGYGGGQSSWSDRLYLNLLPEEARKLQPWPQKPEKLSEMADEYSKKMRMLFEGIYKAMARCLNLKEDSFLNQTKQDSVFGKLSIYPRCSCPERVLGVRPHSDASTIAVLLPEPGVEGLQVEKDNQWFKLPDIPGALFVNLGDFGVVASNGIFKSIIHRVVTNSKKDRISWGAFSAPAYDIEVGPVDELITADQPQQYKKFIMADLMKNSAGRSMLEVLKL